jgi:hypothetical protein
MPSLSSGKDEHLAVARLSDRATEMIDTPGVAAVHWWCDNPGMCGNRWVGAAVGSRNMRPVTVARSAWLPLASRHDQRVGERAQELAQR